MTLMEKLKQLLGSKLDDEIDEVDEQLEKKDKQTEKIVETKEEIKKEDEKDIKENNEVKTVEENKENNKNLENQEVKTEDTVEEKEVSRVLFEDGWFNSENGEVDESKITDPEALKAIRMLTTRYKEEKDKRTISDSLNEELKNYSLAVSDDTIKKVLDMSNVKIDKDGKVVGVKEALETLKTSEPGFFKDKEKESNPLNEGFNPVEKNNNQNINSFAQAFKLMEEIS